MQISVLTVPCALCANGGQVLGFNRSRQCLLKLPLLKWMWQNPPPACLLYMPGKTTDSRAQNRSRADHGLKKRCTCVLNPCGMHQKIGDPEQSADVIPWAKKPHVIGNTKIFGESLIFLGITDSRNHESDTLTHRGIERGKGKVPVTQGQRFALFPQDGLVRVHVDDDEQGPFGALGKFCALPDGSALTYDGPFDCGDGGVELSYEECLELAALGYMADCESLSDAPDDSP